MYIVVIAWGYVVLMMALAERSVVAGAMTFLMYCVLPLTIIVYLFGAPQRRQRRQMTENSQKLIISSPELSRQDEMHAEQISKEH